MAAIGKRGSSLIYCGGVCRGWPTLVQGDAIVRLLLSHLPAVVVVISWVMSAGVHEVDGVAVDVRSVAPGLELAP